MPTLANRLLRGAVALMPAVPDDSFMKIAARSKTHEVFRKFPSALFLLLARMFSSWMDTAKQHQLDLYQLCVAYVVMSFELTSWQRRHHHTLIARLFENLWTAVEVTPPSKRNVLLEKERIIKRGAFTNTVAPDHPREPCWDFQMARCKLKGNKSEMVGSKRVCTGPCAGRHFCGACGVWGHGAKFCPIVRQHWMSQKAANSNARAWNNRNGGGTSGVDIMDKRIEVALRAKEVQEMAAGKKIKKQH